MKIHGTGQPPAPPPPTEDGVDSPAKTGANRAPQTSGTSFSEKLAGPGSTEKLAAKLAVKLDGTGSSRATSPTNQGRATGSVPVTDLAAELRAGRLTPQAAAGKVLERVVEKQVGPGAPPEVRDRIRGALQDALENDPVLAEKLSRLV